MAYKIAFPNVIKKYFSFTKPLNTFNSYIVRVVIDMRKLETL